MTTSRFFEHPKDPASVAWYTIDFGRPLTQVVAVTASVSTLHGIAPSGAAQWTTAGDALLGGDLTLDQVQAAAGGQGATFRVSGGVPGTVYAIRADVVDETGSETFASVLLRVTGQ